MFTGLIERTGRLEALHRVGGGGRLTVAHDPWTPALEPGESIAVQGACLTVARPEPGRFVCDVLEESLRRTSLGDKPPGARLNLERARRAGDRFGGHFVTGHVDGTGALVSRGRADAGDWVLRISCPEALIGGIVPKGCIACDGVSLTVVDLDPDGFSVHVIPFTLDRTSLGDLRPGDAVNIETDLLGKYVQRHAQSPTARPAVDEAMLRRAGFAAN